MSMIISVGEMTKIEILNGTSDQGSECEFEMTA